MSLAECVLECPCLNCILNGEWLIPRWSSHKIKNADWFISPIIHIQKEIHVIQSIYSSCWLLFMHGNTFTSVISAWNSCYTGHAGQPRHQNVSGRSAKLCHRQQTTVCSWRNEVALALLDRYQNWGTERISTAFPGGLKNINAFIEEALLEPHPSGWAKCWVFTLPSYQHQKSRPKGPRLKNKNTSTLVTAFSLMSLDGSHLWKYSLDTKTPDSALD